jgi:mannose-6-phosphate isomerase
MKNLAPKELFQQECPRHVITAWAKKLPRTFGGYAESVDPLWKETPVASRNFVTQARFAYTLCHCSRLGNMELDTLVDMELSRMAVAASRRLMSVFWKPELRGWIHSADKDGNPEDTTIDTYDQSFGLLALAWDFRVRNNPESLKAAREVFAALGEYARAPRGGGYLERRPGGKAASTIAFPGLRRQDPHMHLFEAFTAWLGFDQPGPWRAGAEEILGLLREKFRQTDGSLAAYFDEELNPDAGEAGKIRVPGDHYEWTWLLRQYEMASGDSSVRKDAEGLYAFAQDHGRDRDGLAFSCVDAAGNALDKNKLFWMQAEMLKAHLAMYEWTEEAAFRAAAEEMLALIREKYMRSNILFYNKLNADGSPDTSPTFTRLIYHFFIAASEAKRILYS